MGLGCGGGGGGEKGIGGGDGIWRVRGSVSWDVFHCHSLLSIRDMAEWLSRNGRTFGCSICSAALGEAKSKRDKLATFSVTVLRKSNVLRHQASTLHLRSCELIRSGCQPASETPRFDEFMRLWEHRRSGGSLDACLEGTTAKSHGGLPSRKLKAMQWCIAEARRTRFWTFLKTDVSATLTQDARQSK